MNLPGALMLEPQLDAELEQLVVRAIGGERIESGMLQRISGARYDDIFRVMLAKMIHATAMARVAAGASP